MKYYLDTEFNGFGGDLISVALVREDGASYYAFDSLIDGPVDPWVAENVIPILHNVPCAYNICDSDMMALGIQDFFKGDKDPVIITDWPDDVGYLCSLLITGPGKMIAVPGIKFEVHRVDAYPTTLPNAVQHNAWWDAMALRHLFEEK